MQQILLTAEAPKHRRIPVVFLDDTVPPKKRFAKGVPKSGVAVEGFAAVQLLEREDAMDMERSAYEIDPISGTGARSEAARDQGHSASADFSAVGLAVTTAGVGRGARSARGCQRPRRRILAAQPHPLTIGTPAAIVFCNSRHG